MNVFVFLLSKWDESYCDSHIPNIYTTCW